MGAAYRRSTYGLTREAGASVRRTLADPLAGIRVLVVEDHSDSRNMLEEALEFLGATVIAVMTAEAAAARLADADVVVTDFALTRIVGTGRGESDQSGGRRCVRTQDPETR